MGKAKENVDPRNKTLSARQHNGFKVKRVRAPLTVKDKLKVIDMLKSGLDDAVYSWFTEMRNPKFQCKPLSISRAHIPARSLREAEIRVVSGFSGSDGCLAMVNTNKERHRVFNKRVIKNEASYRGQDGQQPFLDFKMTAILGDVYEEYLTALFNLVNWNVKLVFQPLKSAASEFCSSHMESPVPSP
ncbi:Uncharacterized protein APZ42_031473 [Daphnia magna]|uniref:Uncharacterized protein n=1 Tax=Daphnia magna TaxID=35525 RepID=A0A164MUA2_9CRUS|nr:Uncharacterized protein APZ42_031473 [Daphnia magna]